jgi:hypothetical protein
VSEQHLDVLAQPTRLAPQDFAIARAIKLGAPPTHCLTISAKEKFALLE